MHNFNSKVYHYFSYIWFINKWFGLKNRSIKSPHNERKKLAVIGSYLYIGIVIAIGSMFVWYKLKTTTVQREMKLLPQYTDILMMSSVLCASIAAIAMNLLYQHELQFIFKNIQSVEKKISTFGKSVSYRKIKRYTFVLLSCIGVYWIVHFIYYNFYADRISDITELLFWICTYVPFIVSNVYTAQFIAFCFIIGTLYRSFNDILLNTVPKTILKLNKNTTVQHAKRLEEVQLFHNKLYNLVTAVNDIHSLPLLVIFAANFIFMFACTYFCLFGYMYKNRFVKPSSIFDYLVPIITGIPVFLQFLFIILASEYVSKQRIATGKIIHTLSVSNNNKTLSKWVCMQ